MLHLLLAAEGQAEHAEVMDLANFMPGITALVVFMIALGVLYVKVWPQITKGLDERQSKILEEIESAEAARRQADAALSEYQDNLATARREAAEMITKAKTDAKAVADELRGRNETELLDMKDRARRDIDAARRAAVTDIHRESAKLASAIATKILKRELTDRDQQQLVDESLRELANVHEG